jgi:uncharacterized protein (TIGR00369 family)
LEENIIETYNRINNFGRYLGMDYEILAPGKVEYRMKCTENLLATEKHIHGGALAAMMDAVAGVAALSAVFQESKRVATIEFKINYLLPVALGDELRGVGEVIRKGGKIIVSEGKIYNQHQELVAMAVGTFNSYVLK